MREYLHEWADFKYRTPSAFERQGGLWPIRMGRNRAKADYWVGPRAIECFSLHLVLQGHARLITPGRELRLETGDLFCLHPDIPYQYGLDPGWQDDSLQLAWLAFDGPQARSLVREMGITSDQPVLRGLADQLMPEWEILFGSFDEDDGLYHAMALLGFLLALFSRLRPSPAKGANRADEQRPVNKLLAAKAYLDLHFREGITVQEAARQAKLNRSYFTERFKAEFGLSPRDYLQLLRMEEARSLLRDTTRSVTDIGLTVGYQDLFGFTRAFVREHGVSPTVYRSTRA